VAAGVHRLLCEIICVNLAMIAKGVDNDAVPLGARVPDLTIGIFGIGLKPGFAFRRIVVRTFSAEFVPPIFLYLP